MRVLALVTFVALLSLMSIPSAESFVRYAAVNVYAAMPAPSSVPRRPIVGAAYSDTSASYFRAMAVIAHSTGGSIDTTGASLLVVIACSDGAPTFTDSKGTGFNTTPGTWNLLQSLGNGGANVYRMWACEACTTGTGHSISGSGGFGGFIFAAFSGTKTSAAARDQEQAGAFIAPTPIVQVPTGITPTEGAELILFGGGSNSQGWVSVDSGLSIIRQINTGAQYGVALSFVEQTSAAFIQPAYTMTGTGGRTSVNVVSFKAAGGGGGPTTVPVPMIIGGKPRLSMQR